MLPKTKIITLFTGAIIISPLIFVVLSFVNNESNIKLPFFSVLKSTVEFDVDSNETFDHLAEESQKIVNILPKSKPQEIEVRSLYLTAHSAANPTKLDSIIALIDATELNSVVIDIKDYTGNIYYEADLPLAKEKGIVKNVLSDLPQIIQKLHDHNIYVIARQTVFQDPALAIAMPEWAIKSSVGGLWKDWKGLTWVDPTITEVWDYQIALAKDAAKQGFDEINFDYIRFPSDGPIREMRFANWDGSFSKSETMAGFFAALYTEMKDEPVWISGDLFGLTTIRTDDMNIGQRLEDAAPFFHYIMPMMYPSHYPTGFRGHVNPADHPYDILYSGVVTANERLKKVPNNIAKIRPWIQDFDIGAVYGPEKVQAQIQAIADAGGFGYASWNARNVYSWSDYKTEP